MRKLIIFIACLSLVSIAQKNHQASANDIDSITVSKDGKVYTNQLFGMKIVKPTTWYSQQVEELIQIQKLGVNLLAGEDQNIRALAQESLKSSLPLFGFYRYAPGTAGKSNPNISGVAENIEVLPGIKTGCDYLANAKSFAAQSQITINFEEGCQTKQINGTTLGLMRSTLEFGNIKANQKYFACIHDSHAIAVVANYYYPQEEQLIDNVINTLEIDCK